MLLTFLLKCRIAIEATISTPLKGFFVRNESSMRLAYLKDGSLKYINLATPLDAAKFLKKHRIIDWYCAKSKDDYRVKMYRFNCVLNDDLKWKRWRVPVEWNELELTAAQVHTIAAKHELDNNSAVKEYIKKYFRSAA
jgi:hypothetical protein